MGSELSPSTSEQRGQGLPGSLGIYSIVGDRPPTLVGERSDGPFVFIAPEALQMGTEAAPVAGSTMKRFDSSPALEPKSEILPPAIIFVTQMVSQPNASGSDSSVPPNNLVAPPNTLEP
ncbi:hypothetical protein [Nannocystis punicea]|uniref:Uncharacterized protein n=1 Tax=Nannocystis punicea TaxID=2995304 RepID=A0ABY7HC95_9BACT|nr:hypothetical protein [Nannocystis poenicansa]WAS96884.1 hypothetical protein O0S08_12110 [Nannocystis poenicansa]